jgi:hypothetical protein
MDDDQRIRLIEGRLDALEGMPVSDDPAHDAFTRVLVTADSQGSRGAMAGVRRQA